jgi:hypothetical protein
MGSAIQSQTGQRPFEGRDTGRVLRIVGSTDRHLI